MKRAMVIEVRGKNKLYNFSINEDEENLKEWKAQGLDISLSKTTGNVAKKLLTYLLNLL